MFHVCSVHGPVPRREGLRGVLVLPPRVISASPSLAIAHRLAIELRLLFGYGVYICRHDAPAHRTTEGVAS